MDTTVLPIAIFGMISIGALALFGFLAVSVWADARRQEREAFYRGETLKRIAELQGAGAEAAAQLVREQERALARRAIEGQKLGGSITFGVGAALMVFLRAVQPDKPAYMVGLIPLLVGAALLLYVFVLRGKD